MTNIIIFILISLSISYMWSFSEIFRPIRNFIAKIPYIRRPLICPECSSFWMGLLTSFIFNPIYPLIGFTYLNMIISHLLCGLLTHLVAANLYKKQILN